MKARSPARPEQPHSHGCRGQDGNAQLLQAKAVADSRPELAWQQGLLSLMAGSPRVQRKFACGTGAGSTASCLKCQQKKALPLQTKLRINEPGDQYEQEADRIADEVMRMPEPRVQRQTGPEEDEEAERVQRIIADPITPVVLRQVLSDMDGEEVIPAKTIGGHHAPSAPTIDTSEAPPSVHEVLRSPGQPLDPEIRAFMEPRFGHDFSRVRVHSDPSAEQSALEVNALAYTVGHHIVFGAGRFVPNTNDGRHLVAHELTHVLQQTVISALAGSHQPTIPTSRAAEACLARSPDIESVRNVARDLVHKELPGADTNLPLDVERGLRRLAGQGGKAGEAASRLLDELGRLTSIASTQHDLRVTNAAAKDFLRRHGIRPRSGQKPDIDLLERLARTEGGEASAKRASELASQVRELSRSGGLLQRDQGLAERVTEFASLAKNTADRVEQAAAKTIAKTEAAAVQALVKVEETAIKAEAKLGSSIAAGAGRLGLSLLLPGPEDAIMLMINFAGSYQEAWDIIEQRNMRKGIAFGIAAGMMGLDWGWVTQNLWRRFAEPDVATLVVAAVGLAERAFNDGLVRGHRYGAGYPLRLKNRILKETFTILAKEGYLTDEEGLFTIDTVGRVARVLMPMADDFLRQAAERKQARERREDEQRRKEIKETGSVGFKF